MHRDFMTHRHTQVTFSKPSNNRNFVSSFSFFFFNIRQTFRKYASSWNIATVNEKCGERKRLAGISSMPLPTEHSLQLWPKHVENVVRPYKRRRCSNVVSERVETDEQNHLRKSIIQLLEISDILMMPKCSAFTVLHKHLSARKVCSKWIPYLLTLDQRQVHVDDSEPCLELLRQNKRDFLIRFAAMDNTWTLQGTTEQTQQWHESRPTGESHLKRPKRWKPAGNVTASVFSGDHSTVFIDNLENETKYQGGHSIISKWNGNKFYELIG